MSVFVDPMIACFDVHYFDDYANAAAVVFRNWSDAQGLDSAVARCDISGEYTAGEFYKRELNPLLTLIGELCHQIDIFVIDAYCQLSEDGTPGLGKYLHERLPDGSSVIGVAKNRFRRTNHAVELLRGESNRPLFVTAVGTDYQKAAGHVESMHGSHRIPSLLKMVDHLARNGG